MFQKAGLSTLNRLFLGCDIPVSSIHPLPTALTRKHMTRISIAGTLILASTLAFANVPNDNLFLRCSTAKQANIALDIKLFEKSKGNATLVLDAGKQSGTVLATEYFYHISFTATETGARSLMSINRYTGHFKWETGNDPFGVSSTDNIVHSGTCETAYRKF